MNSVVVEVNARMLGKSLSLVNAVDIEWNIKLFTVCRQYCFGGGFKGEIVSTV